MHSLFREGTPVMHTVNINRYSLPSLLTLQADIVAQTKIIYHEKELLQLIHEHLVNIGMDLQSVMTYLICSCCTKNYVGYMNDEVLFYSQVWPSRPWLYRWRLICHGAAPRPRHTPPAHRSSRHPPQCHDWWVPHLLLQLLSTCLWYCIPGMKPGGFPHWSNSDERQWVEEEPRKLVELEKIWSKYGRSWHSFYYRPTAWPGDFEYWARNTVCAWCTTCWICVVSKLRMLQMLLPFVAGPSFQHTKPYASGLLQRRQHYPAGLQDV